MRRRAGGQRMIDGADLARFLTRDVAPAGARIQRHRVGAQPVSRHRHQGREGRPRGGGAHPGRPAPGGVADDARGRRRARARARRPRGRCREVHERRRGSPAGRMTAIDRERRKEQFVLKRMRWAAVLVASIALAAVATAAPATAAKAKAPKLSGLDHGVGGGVAHRGVHQDGHRLPEASTRAPRSRSTTRASSTLAQQIQGGAPGRRVRVGRRRQHAEAGVGRSGHRRSRSTSRRTCSRSW